MRDLISRQAAIDAICEHGTGLERRGITVLAVVDHKQITVDLLETLPSAQPEIIRCKDCVHADEYYHCDYMTTWNDADCFCYYAERKKE